MFLSLSLCDFAMTKEEFIQKLARYGINSCDVMAENAVEDGYGLRKNYYRWEIFYRERGVEYNVRGFPSERDALRALFEDIVGE